MKSLKVKLTCLLVLATIYSYSQNCDKLIQGGLYSFTNMVKSGSFSKDLRTYYLSEQFKSDLKNGKWGGSLTIPIEGIPFSIGADFSEDQFSEFKSKILSVTELNISQNFYQTSFSTIPNTNLYDAYVKCVQIEKDLSKTGFIQGENVETEDIVVFTIYYRPQAPGDPMPVVKDFTIQPEGSIQSGGFKIGETLNSFSLLVTAKRNLEKDLILTLVTDRGTFISKSAAEGSFSSSKELPIGTIVSSMLDFTQFSFTTKNNEKSPGNLWTSIKSKWAPCDGRLVANSKYSILSSAIKAPDLRGVFLRGLNQFDGDEKTIPDPKLINPEKKLVGEYQSDTLQSHNHSYTASLSSTKIRGDGGYAPENPSAGTTGNFGGAETRPKNVSIFYYIKIN